MFLLAYVKNGEVFFKNFEDKHEANNAFKVLNKHNLPIFASDGYYYSQYHIPKDFRDESEYNADASTIEKYNELISKLEDEVGIVKGADYEYSPSLNVYMLYFFGKRGKRDGAIGILGKTTYCVL